MNGIVTLPALHIKFIITIKIVAQTKFNSVPKINVIVLWLNSARFNCYVVSVCIYMWAIPDNVWVVYFSLSRVSFPQEHIKSMQRSHQVHVAAIGPTTAEALASAGVQVDATSNKLNPECLVQTITGTVLL